MFYKGPNVPKPRLKTSSYCDLPNQNENKNGT